MWNTLQASAEVWNNILQVSAGVWNILQASGDSMGLLCVWLGERFG